MVDSRGNETQDIDKALEYVLSITCKSLMALQVFELNETNQPEVSEPYNSKDKAVHFQHFQQKVLQSN